MKRIVFGLVVVLVVVTGVGAVGQGALGEKTKPTINQFLGLNVHTVNFKPGLYQPVTKLVRDYHSMEWDVGNETDFWVQFPFARNRVNWLTMYGDWVEKGYQINASIMFNNTPHDGWVDLERDAHTYGFALARYFGPNGKGLLESTENGNEPGKYPDETYRRMFEAMAKGMRAGDPDLLVSTCAVFARESGDYHKSVETVRGLDELYDVINVHSYAQAEGWPTWKRSYPEDPSLEYLTDIRDVIDWRDEHAPGKQVWLTEFGYDSSTKEPDQATEFRNWQGQTDTEQARYIVRSVLLFAAMDIDRAYIYFYNDSDQPSVHAASGLTRNYEPKPSFHAVAHLRAVLGDYRFSGVVRESDEAYVYRFVSGDGEGGDVLVAWSPTGSDRTGEVVLDIDVSDVLRAERMPLEPGEAPRVDVTDAGGRARVTIGESPVYVFLER